MERKDKKITLLLGTLLGVSALLLASPQNGGDDPYVHLVKASSVRMITDENQKAYRQAVNATFLHNDTYLICDTAYWRVDENIINAFGNVRLTQDGTELTSQKLDYYVDDNLAQFRGGVVQLQDKENNILRTHFLDYNTADSVAVFSKGASMKDKDGQVIESIDGTYDSKAGLFTFSNNVNMFTDSVFIKTQSLDYHTETQKAVFKTYIDLWKDDNMLSAQKGWYDRERELFFFTGSVHATTKDNESWCDSLYYYRNLNNVLMRGTVQLQDSIRNTSAVSRYLFYEDSLATVTLMDEAAVSIVTQQEGQPADTLYFGADTLVYYTLKYCDIPASEIKNAKERLADILTDPVGEYRRKAAEAAEAAAQAAKEKAAGTRPELRPEGSAAPGAAAAGAEPAVPALAGEPRGSEESVKPAASGAETAGIEPVAKGQKNGAAKTQPDSLASGQLDSLALRDSTAKTQPDSLALQDSLKVQTDSILTAAADSTMLASADSTLLVAVDSTELKVEVDTTKYGFAFARGNVKVFRKDIQVRCDSLRYCDLDSIARFYKNPVVWNEENRQYYSDSLFALIRNNAMDRASLLSNAFVVTQEDSLLYDQIRGAEVLAYFDSTSALKRFDALGDAVAIFYLEENNTLATVNKVECKMLSGNFVNGTLDRVFYYDSPKNDAYPVVQFPQQDRILKGFKWEPERRPKGKEDITTLSVRPSQRAYYDSRPGAEFKQTDLYFPGYIKSVYASIDERNRKRNQPARQSELLEEPELLQPQDSLEQKKELAEIKDSLAMKDSLALRDSVAVKDSTMVEGAQTQVKKNFGEWWREQVDKWRKRREERWARLDERDAKREAEKQEKALKKKREKTRKELIERKKQEQKEQELLQKYIEEYEKEKAKKDGKVIR